jgi:hypothetical protein
LQELIEKSPTTMLEFDHATVEQFRHALRGRIIDRWVTLGQEHTADNGKMAREIEEKENLVRSLIGKNVLPSLPFVILCILEADQEGKAQSAEAGWLSLRGPRNNGLERHKRTQSTTREEVRFSSAARLPHV